MTIDDQIKYTLVGDSKRFGTRTSSRSLGVPFNLTDDLMNGQLTSDILMIGNHAIGVLFEVQGLGRYTGSHTTRME